MSNRRKSLEERQGQRGYGRKSRYRKPMFPGLAGMFDFEVMKGRDEEQPSAPSRRALSGKDRVRARRGQR